MDYKKIIRDIRGQGYLYVGLLLGVFAIAYAILKLGYVVGAAIAVLPLVTYIILYCIKYPYWAFTLVFIINYFIMGVIRYFPSVPGGVVMDCLIMFCVFTLLVRTAYKKVGWDRVRNGLTIAALIWLVYCFLELFNPLSVSAQAWASSIRGYAIYFFVIVILTPIIFYRYKDLKRILAVWSVLTLLAVAKAWYQRHYGFDAGELNWLFVRGGYTTHIIHSGVRYFSFFSDAANYGGGMGLSMVVFSIVALFFKNRWVKFYYLAVAFAAAYGMVISGTRGALAVPFAGYMLYILISRQTKIVVGGAALLLAAFVFLNYTHIGHGNALVRRARSAFNTEDRSLQVRLENQRLLRDYMKDKPFGVGLGLGGGKAKQYAPTAFASQIPTDSWFVMIWVESGIVGLILNLCVLFYILGYGMWIVMFRLKDKQLRGITGALVAGIFGVMVSSYGNEILGQFPTGMIIYMSQAFIFISPRFDRELADAKRKKELHEHECNS